jgi:hypothetical protein
MDQHSFDFAPEADLSNDLDWAPAASPARSTPTLTNSPGCSPAPVASFRLADRAPLRRVRTVASSVPASASWARPSRTLRKVSRRAVDQDGLDPA